jgi:hypothetical protein
MLAAADDPRAIGVVLNPQVLSASRWERDRRNVAEYEVARGGYHTNSVQLEAHSDSGTEVRLLQVGLRGQSAYGTNGRTSRRSAASREIAGVPPHASQGHGGY